MLARAGHDLVHERFCVERMVAAIADVYDEGARRPYAARAGADCGRPAGPSRRSSPRAPRLRARIDAPVALRGMPVPDAAGDAPPGAW